ncbi:DnaJ domain [Dillenia turbinata]|uniref:DnaJ domain n=1 Tax=Dillenia turbinata TaxID=194707 RepID=A0AAN8YSW4_9MAGN
MNCNKEEAIRAFELAEKKMQMGDFPNARRTALKAQQLFPDLENISQMLTVCNIHCAAQKKIFGSEMDWYGILQVEQLADEASIKKQYRKLALVLHPDKNKFAGAEAAFKLIGEANRVLLDSVKRSTYDMKCKVTIKSSAPKAPPHQVNRNSFVGKQFGVPNDFSSVSSQFNGVNLNQQSQSAFAREQQKFWTICPFCSMRFQYYSNIMNRSLRCQNCHKPFIAYDMGAQSVPPGPNWNQPPLHEAFKTGPQSSGINPTLGMGYQSSFSSKPVFADGISSAGSKAKFSGNSKRKGNEDGRVKAEFRREGVHMPMGSKSSKNTSRKRGRTLVVDSSDSESFETESSSESEEDEVIQLEEDQPAGVKSSSTRAQPCRRSSRQRQKVSYKETGSDDDNDEGDFVHPTKKSGKGGLANSAHSGGSAAVADGNEKIKLKGNAHIEESLPNGNKKAENAKYAGEATAMAQKNKELNNDVYSLGTEDSSPPNMQSYECPDPDFSNFDEVKKESSFSAGQVWASYDIRDGMPRFYALVRKVSSPQFKLQITWLEPKSGREEEIEWLHEGLPTACGNYILGNADETSNLLIFSHQVHYKMGKRHSYLIHPQKGETWALFRNWDISWSSNPQNHTKYTYDFVEVVSDYDDDAGVMVAYLDKVKGFVSLFQRTTEKEGDSVQIPSTELLRFSHQIPSFRLSGTEREGVPEGSLELDPASLPQELFKH